MERVELQLGGGGGRMTQSPHRQPVNRGRLGTGWTPDQLRGRQYPALVRRDATDTTPRRERRKQITVDESIPVTRGQTGRKR